MILLYFDTNVLLLFQTLLIACTTMAMAQYDNPTPPRLSIPGAIPIPIRQAQGGRPFKNERQIHSPNIVKIRRPLVSRPQPINAITAQTPRAITLNEEAKPVIEEYEDESNEPFVPQLISNPPQQPPHQQQQQVQQQSTQALFSNDQNIFENDDQSPVSRFQPQDRPAPQRAQERFVPIDVPQPVQRFNPTPQAQPPKPNQYRAQRPTYREPQPQRNQYQPEPEQIRQVPARVADVKPRPHSSEQRERKPVAQILRKYREENEDGTITWGYENDDGSFKEEVIGTDCVTR